MLKEIEENARGIADELYNKSGLKKGDLVVIGCSTSEVMGYKIGSNSHIDVARAIYKGISQVFNQYGIFMAVQCCEHLNRALIIEKEVADEREIVHVTPKPNAGGAFATVCYEQFKNPVAVEFIKADAGIDIGNTFIGMHLKHVAVPLRTEIKIIGKANVTTARTRYKFIGGPRAFYE